MSNLRARFRDGILKFSLENLPRRGPRQFFRVYVSVPVVVPRKELFGLLYDGWGLYARPVVQLNN